MDSDGRQVTGGDRAWAGHAGGPADPCSLSALATADSTTLTGPELVDAIVASEKALSLLSGVQMRLLTALAKPVRSRGAWNPPAAELAA